ncbi:hypothetical protein [Gelidibacter pelagius]|uniref:Uncharacterized protein n=1 Tax=Gelidibacter pelagius TaxID=2819985 RepID=A0ABS3SWB9_9FLAO|nr:hypothetical protein [Gelidibacter pelagius]MBO3100040.1 hypothetical protein [Gelidibacter pelagius]
MEISEVDLKKIAKECFENVFRTDTEHPGFAHIDLGKDIDSSELRSIMVALKNELSHHTSKAFNKKLAYHWLVRFDQQVNTPYHVDNAGDQSFLMLGYEPSNIKSELYLADYYKFAQESDDAPKEYLENFSPVFKDDERLLSSFITKIEPFKKDTYNIVLINNSNPTIERETLGVFHKATMLNPDPNKRRIVNSMLINMVHRDFIDEDENSEAAFMKTDVVSK